MREAYGLDFRSLAILRISLGLVLVFNLLQRAPDLVAHYTSEGVLPASIELSLAGLEPGFRPWSLFYLTDSPWFVGLAMLLGLMGSLALTLGYRTVVAGWLCWIILISLHHRNPLLLNSGDIYLLLLLFWGNFLPWGRVFALDAPPHETPTAKSHLSIAGLAYLFQICYVYWFAALPRTGPSWQVSQDALYKVLHQDGLITRVGERFLYLGQDWLAFLTWSTMVFEIVGPFLLLTPFYQLRLLGIASIIGFHAGLILVMQLGLFPWICILAVFGLWPSQVWATLAGRWLQERLTTAFHSLANLLSRAPRKRTLEDSPAERVLLRNLVPGFFFLLSTYGLVGDQFGWDQSQRMLHFLRQAGLHQKWRMFSPDVNVISGWDSVEAVTESGQVLDLITGSAYPQGGYQRRSLPFVERRWTEYSATLRRYRSEPLTELYLRYLVTQWDRNNPDNKIVQATHIWHARVVREDFLLGQEMPQILGRYRP